MVWARRLGLLQLVPGIAARRDGTTGRTQWLGKAKNAGKVKKGCKKGFHKASKKTENGFVKVLEMGVTVVKCLEKGRGLASLLLSSREFVNKEIDIDMGFVLTFGQNHSTPAQWRSSKTG